jgi:LysW-gamma-L-lysine/LysW-L-ornithine aminotransferase
MTTTIELENQYTSGLNIKRQITLVRGEGALLWDDAGKEYIDCIAGHGSANMGHGHPAILAALIEQARTLMVCNENFYNPRRAELEARLVNLAGGGLQRVFLCNSGAEAVEGALKFARFSTKKTDFVAAMRGFHGRTMGALSATFNKKYRDPFQPLVPGFRHVPYNNLEALRAAVDEKTAAVILEPIQGEGGVHEGAKEFLLGAQAICREQGALLILDEVQTGFGRTGNIFAFQQFDMKPDLVSVAKSIAGGFPMGAVLIGERVGAFAPGMHFSTFGGNPLACATALAALDVLEKEKLSERAAELGVYLKEKLEEINSPLVREVRGRGLMVGVELRQKVAPFIAALAEEGVLALPGGLTVLRLLPPLVITREQLDVVLKKIALVLSRPIAAEEGTEE